MAQANNKSQQFQISETNLPATEMITKQSTVEHQDQQKPNLMRKSSTVNGALDSAMHPKITDMKAYQGNDADANLDEKARDSIYVKKSNQIIDEILADAENMDGVEDQSGELETIKLSEFKVDKLVLKPKPQLNSKKTKQNKGNMTQEAIEQYRSDAKGSRKRQPYGLKGLNTKMDGNPYYNYDDSMDTLSSMLKPNQGILDNTQYSENYRSTVNSQLESVNQLLSTNRLLYVNDENYISRSKLNKSNIKNAVYENREQSRSRLGIETKSIMDRNSSVTKSQKFDDSRLNMSRMSKLNPKELAYDDNDLQVQGVSPPKNKILQAVIQIEKKPQKVIEKKNILIQQTNKNNSKSLDQTTLRTNESQLLDHMQPYTPIQVVDFGHITQSTNNQTLIHSFINKSKVSKQSSKATLQLPITNVNIISKAAATDKNQPLKTLNVAMAQNNLKIKSRNNIVSNYKSVEPQKYRQNGRDHLERTATGIWQQDRQNHMNDLDLLDCQPWQLTRSLFGKGKKVKAMLDGIDIRQKSLKSKADLFDSIMGQEKGSTMSSVMAANLSVREKSQCLDYLIDEEGRSGADIAEIVRMSRIDYGNDAFKKKLPIPAEAKHKSKEPMTDRQMLLNDPSTDKLNKRIEFKDLQQRINVTNKQKTQFKQLVNLINDRVGANDDSQRKNQSRLNQTQSLNFIHKPLLGASQADPTDSVFQSFMEGQPSNRSPPRGGSQQKPDGKENRAREASMNQFEESVRQSQFIESQKDSSNIKQLSEAFQQLNRQSSQESLKEFNEIYKTTSQPKNNDRLMRTLMVTQSKLQNEMSYNPEVVSKVVPDPRQSQKLHRQLQRIRNNPQHLQRMREQQNSSNWNKNMGQKSLPQLPVIHKPIFTYGSMNPPRQQNIPIKKKNISEIKAAKAQETYERQLELGMHKPTFPMQQEELKFKPNNKLTDPVESETFHSKLDSILGKPVEIPKQESFQQTTKSFSKTKDRTLSKGSKNSNQDLNTTKQSFVSDSFITKLHQRSPLQRMGNDLPVPIINLIQHLQKTKQFQIDQPKLKSKLVERAFEHYQNFNKTEAVLDDLIKQISYEFLEKPTNLQSKEQLELHIQRLVEQDLKNQNRKLKDGRLFKETTYDSRTDHKEFAKFHVHKLQGFSDHRGNTITKSGYLIDDYKVKGEDEDGDQDENVDKKVSRESKRSAQMNKFKRQNTRVGRSYQPRLHKFESKKSSTSIELSELRSKSKSGLGELNAAQKYMLKQMRIQEKNKVKLNNINSDAQMKKVSKFEERIEKDRIEYDKTVEEDAMVHSQQSLDDGDHDELSIINSLRTRTLFNLDNNLKFGLTLHGKGAGTSQVSSRTYQTESAQSTRTKNFDYPFIFAQLFEHANAITSEQQQKLLTDRKMLICNQRQENQWNKIFVQGIEGVRSHSVSTFGLNNEQEVEMKDIQMIESLVITKQMTDSKLASLLKIFVLQVQGTSFKVQKQKMIQEIINANMRENADESPLKSQKSSATKPPRARLDLPARVNIAQLNLSGQDRHVIKQLKFNKVELGDQGTRIISNLIQKAREANPKRCRTTSPKQTPSKLASEQENRIKDLADLDLNWCTVPKAKNIQIILDSLIEFETVEVPKSAEESAKAAKKTIETADGSPGGQREPNADTVLKPDYSLQPVAFVRLQRLSLAGLKLQKPPTSLIHFIQCNLQNLYHLDLSYNQFRLNLLPLLAILETSSCLEYLNLSHTALPSDKFLPSLQALVSAGKDDAGLRHLDLSYTQLTKPVEFMKFIISQKASSLQTIHMDGLLSTSQLKEINRVIHEAHHADHGHKHEFDGDEALSHSYSALGQHHHHHNFMNPDEYTSHKDDYTNDDEDDLDKTRSKIDLHRLRNQGLNEPSDSMSPIRNLEKACAFPQPIVYVNRKDTKELMFHDRLANFEEFEDEFDTVGRLFDDTFENPNFVYRMWKLTNEPCASCKRSEYSIFLYRKGQNLPNLKMPKKGMFANQGGKVIGGKKRTDISQLVFELCPIDLPRLSITYNQKQNSSSQQNQNQGLPPPEKRSVIMMPLLIFAELLGIYIDVSNIKLDSKCAWLHSFLIEVQKRKQEQWADEGNDAQDRDTFGRVYWMGSTDNMDASAKPELEIQRWFASAQYITEGMDNVKVVD